MTDENKPLNYDLIVPKGGKIDGLIFENDHVSIPMTLFYSIEVELNTFEIDDEVIDTSLILDFIIFEINDLKELENRAFDFPIYPETDHINASVYILYTHHPVSVSKITFGKIDNGYIAVTIDYNIEYYTKIRMVLYIMETKKKKAAVTVLGIFVTALFIWLVIVGCNLYKNRWHKINFNINSITVVRTEGDTPYDGIYNGTVKGTASAWFYDFNKYQFDLVPASSGGYYPTFYQKTDTLVVTNKDKTPFEFSFTTKENMDEDCVDTVSRFIYGAENITVNGSPDTSHDIRLFLSEYRDKITVVNK